MFCNHTVAVLRQRYVTLLQFISIIIQELCVETVLQKLLCICYKTLLCNNQLFWLDHPISD